MIPAQDQSSTQLQSSGCASHPIQRSGSRIVQPLQDHPGRYLQDRRTRAACRSLQYAEMGISCSWFAWALLAGTLYLIIGVGFAQLSDPSVLFWRRAAWMVSAVVYAAHIGYEHFRIRNSPRSTALHVAFGAAIGAFELAAAAIVHSLLTGTGNMRLLRLALLIWPLITGVPAFVVALVMTAALARLPRWRRAIPGR